MVVLDDADGVFHHVLKPARVVRRLDFSSRSLDVILHWKCVDLPRKVKRKDVFSGAGFAFLGGWTPEEWFAARAMATPAADGLAALGPGGSKPLRRRMTSKTSR